jgi:single-strand DNA-binding protein
MNKSIMIGRLAADPELRTTQSGISNCNFKIAVQRRFKDNNGERQADFFTCVSWRQTAEFVTRYFKKGDMIAVEGSMQNRSYDAQDGSKRFVTELMVDNVEMCGGSGARKNDNVDAFERQAAQTFGGFTPIEDDEMPF